MIDILLTRFRQRRRTIKWPGKPAPELSDRYRGRPALSPDAAAAAKAAAVCPTAAFSAAGGLDMGRCLFCGRCAAAAPEAVRFTGDFRLAAARRDDLKLNCASLPEPAAALDREAKRLFGRSLKLRQVSAGGCNACEADVNVLNTVVFDLGRFGVQFVASPRHADGVLITGPVSENMREALLATWEATPSPKLAIAVGACAISGGPYAGHPETHDGAGAFVPIDLYVPGCPPHPLTILDGILRLLGKL